MDARAGGWIRVAHLKRQRRAGPIRGFEDDAPSAEALRVTPIAQGGRPELGGTLSIRDADDDDSDAQHG